MREVSKESGGSQRAYKTVWGRSLGGGLDLVWRVSDVLGSLWDFGVLGGVKGGSRESQESFGSEMDF